MSTCTLSRERVLVGHLGEEDEFVLRLSSPFGSVGTALGSLYLCGCIVGDFLEVLGSGLRCLFFGGPCVQLEEGRLWTAMPRPSVTSRCPQP